jgi:hypothetical protein
VNQALGLSVVANSEQRKETAERRSLATAVYWPPNGIENLSTRWHPCERNDPAPNKRSVRYPPQRGWPYYFFSTTHYAYRFSCLQIRQSHTGRKLEHEKQDWDRVTSWTGLLLGRENCN